MDMVAVAHALVAPHGAMGSLLNEHFHEFFLRERTRHVLYYFFRLINMQF